MTTIRDVAERAGVSTMTVSRVLNNSGYVSNDALARVKAAIAELGYVPNSLARSLRSKRTRTLALVLTDIANHFFTTVARGAEDVANKHGFNLILCNTDESEEKQAQYLDVLLQKRVDGVLLVPARSRPEPVARLQQQGVPVVVIDRRAPAADVDTVRGDSEQGAYEITCHLLALGHLQIILLNGPRGVSTADDRAAGYCRAMAEDGPGSCAAFTINGEFTVSDGYRMAQAALERSPRPTALIAANNFIAVGAYRAVRDAGLGVPADMSVVGFDDVPAAIAVEPFMTVVEQPAYEMGRQAAELLIARIAGEAAPECQEIVLPVRVIVRESSGPMGGCLVLT
jgi:LacI family transcriptional regulator